MSTQDALTEINNIAFAAKNQIEYWKRYQMTVTGMRIDSIKSAIESILNICDEELKEEEDNEQ